MRGIYKQCKDVTLWHNICSALFLGTETKAFSFKIRNQLAHNKFANKKNNKSEVYLYSPHRITHCNTIFNSVPDFVLYWHGLYCNIMI